MSLPLPPSRARQLHLRSWDRFRLWRQARRYPGLELHPRASTNFATSDFALCEGSRLRIERGALTERRHGGVRFRIGAGAEVVVGEGAWLCSELGPVHLVAFPGARIELGPRCFLNGCHLSAKAEVVVGERAMVGTGSRIYDSDQHDYDAEHPECTEPVRIGAHSWIGSDVTVLRGVEVGCHSIVGARSVVTRSIPDHTLALGIPATPRGGVGDRKDAR